MRLVPAPLFLSAPVLAQPSVRPVRVDALATGLRDDDLAWIAPPMAGQGGELQRASAHMQAGLTAAQWEGVWEAVTTAASAVDAATRAASSTP
jgi:hypothetical protein